MSLVWQWNELSAGNDLLKRGLKQPEQFAWEATHQAASVIAPSFQGTGSVDCIDSLGGFILNLWSFGRRPCIELAGECYELAPMSRNTQAPTVHKRCTDSISSFVVIQR